MHHLHVLYVYVCVSGFVDNVDRALTSLGGIKTISQVSLSIGVLSHFA